MRRVVARAPAQGETLLFADIDLALTGPSHARQLFLRDRRPGLVPGLLDPGC